jgi:uncharacterized membrane protein YcaP (DUF421 family)
LVDGTPLILMENAKWRSETLARMHIQDVDVMFAARDHGLKSLDDIKSAVLERNGDVSIIPTTPGSP